MNENMGSYASYPLITMEKKKKNIAENIFMYVYYKICNSIIFI